MSCWRTLRRLGYGLGVTALVLGGAYFYAVSPHHSSAPPESAEGLLDRADTLAWGNRWSDAEPLYARAQAAFTAEKNPAKALYAEASRAIPNESVSVQAKILRLNDELATPAAREPETRLRLLTIKGMLETNYDAGQANADWEEVRASALKLGHVGMASRAEGEKGIAAFLLGDTETAKRLVVRAWAFSKVEKDPAATVRYASVFGAGLVEVQRYKEALQPLNEAIKIATNTPGIAYPTIANIAKIDALTGLHQYDDALRLANQSLKRLQGTEYDAHKTEVYIARGTIFNAEGKYKEATADYGQAMELAQGIDDYRGIVNAGGLLAQVDVKAGNLPAALKAINKAIGANTHIPDELHLVPRNLAIKAEIEFRMGLTQVSDSHYREAIALVNNMIQHASTVNNQRYLLAEMSDVYSGFFGSLCQQKRFAEALETLEQVRGRIETEAVEHHATSPIHASTQTEQDLTQLNLKLINTDDPAQRDGLINAIYSTELRISPSRLAQETITHTVKLATLQHDLPSGTLLVEYVLGEPASYAFAITHDSVESFPLPSRKLIESDANRYRKVTRSQKEDRTLAHQLFEELLAPIPAYKNATCCGENRRL